MLNQEDTNKIRQQKLDALVAIELYKQQIRNLRQRNRVVESLSIAVPVFYLTPRLLAKGTLLANLIDSLGEILAAILLVLTILRLVNKWQDDEIQHTIISRRNSDTAYEADRLLQSQTRVTGNILHYLKHGSQLGWLLDPKERSVSVYHADRLPELLIANDWLPALAELGLNLPVEQVFGWLRRAGSSNSS